MNEESMHRSLVKWFEVKYKHSAMRLHHSPNGGARTARAGAKMKALGTRKGFPDLVLYERRNGYVGLVLELKSDRGQVTGEQAGWLTVLSECSFDCHVIKTLDEGIKTIENYMGME